MNIAYTSCATSVNTDSQKMNILQRSEERQEYLNKFMNEIERLDKKVTNYEFIKQQLDEINDQILRFEIKLSTGESLKNDYVTRAEFNFLINDIESNLNSVLVTTPRQFASINHEFEDIKKHVIPKLNEELNALKNVHKTFLTMNN